MNCKKCGKETMIVCLCGICPKCNGTEEKMKKGFDEFINKLKGEFDWTKIKDGSGSWSQGQIHNKIDRCVLEQKDSKTVLGEQDVN